MANMNIIRDEVLEKIKEVTSWEDPREEPSHKVVLDSMFDVE